MKKNTMCILIIFLAIQINVLAYGDSFSCNYGKQAACLDYGDKVCSSFSKCVSNDAVCFDAYTCNYQGYICKSEYQELADEYQNTIDKYNHLVSKQNNLLSCLGAASDLEDTKNCMLYQ